MIFLAELLFNAQIYVQELRETLVVGKFGELSDKPPLAE